MELLMFIFVTVIPVISDGLNVHSPSGPLVAPLGSSVVLPCSVDELLSVEDLEVEWRRTDSETVVHLYQDGGSQTEAQPQDYQDRAHLFTEEIQYGNFSLNLDNLRAEDEGQYTCTIYSQQESSTTVVEIKVDNVEHLIVSGSKQSISATVGEDVNLNCSVDSHIPPEDFEQVSWKKTDKDENILVLLYQKNEALPEATDERYRDRVEFFTAEIPKGNFSLKLKSIRTEDKGVYMCEVFAGGLSANTTAVLEQLGFSVLHILMLILCIAAFVSALLPCCLIYCRCWIHSKTQCQVVQYDCGLTVKGPTGCLFVPLGGSVVLPCHVQKSLLRKRLKVEWTKTDNKTLVHLYQDGESQAEKQHPDYQDRAQFFTDHIKDGNFSLHLDNLRAEDKGHYRCKVYSGQDCVFSAETVVALNFILISPSGIELVHLGDSAVLPCHVDKHLLNNSLWIEWRRTDYDTLVHLYQDGESRAEKQHQDYQDRAHFITGEIKDGNFSVRLEKVKAEDEGEYTCKVYSQHDCVYSANTKLVLCFDVNCSRHTLVPLGSSVVVPCYENKPCTMEGLKVEWRRTDSETLVHLYEDGESQAEKQQQDYQGRAHIFKEHIKDGNFSLHLDKLRAEDEGQYKCSVYSQQESVFSVKTNLEMRLLDTVFRLQMFLIFCPNILMFLAFVLWGVSEGSLFETVFCCSLYFLRPLMLLWAAPYVYKSTGKIKTWIENYSFRTEYTVFSAVFNSVLFKFAWDKSLNYSGFEGVVIKVLFVLVLLLNLFYIIYLLMKFIVKLSERIVAIFRVLASTSFNILHPLQFILLFFAFGSTRGGLFIVAVLPVLLTVTHYNWDAVCGQEMGCSPSFRRSAWLIITLLVNAVMVYIYIIALENEKDRVGWACMIAFLQLLWAVIHFTWSFEWDLPRVAAVYVFGSVGVVLLNSVALMTELLLKTVNGEGAMGDLRIVVFSSEFLFTLFLMVLLVFEPCIKPWLQSCQNTAADSDGTPASGSNQNTTKSQEMKPLLNKQNQETRRSESTEETQPDSVVSQT